MKTKIHLLSFILSFVCIVLFFLATSSRVVVDFVLDLTHIHPLMIVLIISLATFLLGVIGFAGMNGWKALLRSISTVGITLTLSVIITFILIVGNLFT